MSTRQQLRALIQAELKGAKLIVVSSREPYVHSREGGQTTCARPVGGLAAALDPIMRAAGGVWVAHGSGTADAETVDQFDRIAVPPEDPSYQLRRVWMDDHLRRGCYNRLANEGLWPLCHISFTRPIFRPGDWEGYRRANQIFAKAVLEEADGAAALVFIQDYHFGLLPRMLKEQNPKLVVAQFWHIPWPNWETFRVFPWKEEFLRGLLGNDLLGFQLREHCLNFLETVDRSVKGLVDTEDSKITLQGSSTIIHPFPISLDFENHTQLAASAETDAEMGSWRELLHLSGSSIEFLGIGIDRIDYTKGIPDRLLGLDAFFEEHPQYRGRLQFVQIGVPSRSELGQYEALGAELEKMIQSINDKWATPAWKPILFFKQYFSPHRLMALHRLAHFCVVTSLHDGMNLVAKEYVASRFDEDGVLVLSRFTGSARELPDALLVNPFAVGEIAEAIAAAVEMPGEERSRRMRRMRRAVSTNNIYDWAAKILSVLLRLEDPSSRSNDVPENNEETLREAQD